MSLRISLTRNALLACGLSLALSACDRDTANPAQEQGALQAGKQSLAGEIDDSRAGQLLPAINVADPAGRQVNLGALQGQPILINLWATWCAPCIREMPMLDDLAEELGDDIRLITVSQDFEGAAKVEPFFAKMKFTNLEPWLDPENELGFAINSGVMPTTVLYDASGREVWRVVGEYDWSSAEAREAVLAGL